MRFFTIILLMSAFVVSMTSCDSTWHSLEFQNTSEEIVNYSTQGIRLYGHGGGPQNLGGWCHPGVSSSYSVMGPIYLTYPIRVSWESKDSGKKGTQEFMSIPGVPEGAEKITKEGVLIVGLTPDCDLKVFFVAGDTVDSKLYREMLKGEVPLPQ